VGSPGLPSRAVLVRPRARGRATPTGGEVRYGGFALTGGRSNVRMLTILACTVLLASAALAQEYVWLEGESPTRSNYEVTGSGWGNKQFLSGEAWLNVSIDAEKVAEQCPQGGIVLAYDFAAPSAGSYEVWNRIGFEFVRSAFEWRIDNGAWATVPPDALTTDLMEIEVWCEVAWLKLGTADLTQGNHALEIRLTPGTRTENGEQKPDKILYSSDLLCLSRGTFHPNGKFRPDEDWQTDQDREAAQRVVPVAVDGAAGERGEVDLSGLWQVCRYDENEVTDRNGPTTTLPAPAEAFWRAIAVPGNKFQTNPELRLCHRLVYRTKVEVPQALAGRSVFLRLPSLSMIGSVLVNGQLCGWTKAMFALFECDITPAVKFGAVNEIAVVIKDGYYAFSEKKSGRSCRMSFNTPVAWMGSRNFVNQDFDYPIGAEEYAQNAGILEAPSLVVTGPVYASDVFVKPSVQRKELGVQITLRNPSTAARTVHVACTAVPVGGGEEKAVPPQTVAVPAGGEATVNIAEPWADARLWWPDEPNLYELTTRISSEGTALDTHTTRFGFREWGWSGRLFTVNGVPWQFFADTTTDRDPEAAIGAWRRNGQNMWRFWGRTFAGLDKQRALDLMDERGIVVRRSGIFDGQGANYLAGLSDNPALYENWVTQMQAWVREERNHPSILIWSMENEITFINSRNLGQADAVEPEMAKAADVLMALDPTRPVMVDGGNCLKSNALPVNGVHYMESAWRSYPDEAYTLEQAYQAHVTNPGWNIWQLVPDKPIFMGESFYVRGSTPSAFAQFGGEGCFSGWGSDTRIGVGRLCKMLAEGYRWHGVAATHFWMTSGETDLHYNSWQPVAVLCREWNWTFGPGSTVTRQLKAFNNTHLAGDITVGWQLSVGGARVAGEEKVVPIPAGGSQELSVQFTTPAATARTEGEFTLTCSRDGNEVFREAKPVAILGPTTAPKPELPQDAVVVLDPHGAAKARLATLGVAFTEVDSPAAVGPEARLVVVGKDALSPREATDPVWVALASRGVRVLVLDQQSPLRYLAVPADCMPTDFAGRVAFAENLDHPAFAGLGQQDFLTWSGDHVVYRSAYRKATRGAVSLVQCDEQLGCSALMECPVEDGLLVLCQLVVGEKLETDPVAQRMFDNLLSYCASYAPVRRSTAVVMSADTPAYRMLAGSGLQFDEAQSVLAAMADGKHEVIVFDATPQALGELAANVQAVRAFAEKGGWLMAWGLTPEGLASFNQVVGVDHMLRPFDLERVGLPASRDPLLSGLTVRDVTLESAEKIFPWAGDRYLVDDEFTFVVDFDDVAPFGEFPGTRAGDGAAARAAEANWARNAVNGFTSADAWKLIHYMPTANPRLSLTLPREERIDRFSVILNTHYCIPATVRLLFDDGPDPVVLATKPNGERQDFDIEPRVARKITIELADFDKPGETTGIDNMWIYAVRPDDWTQRVRPLLNIGGLAKYPIGQGGLVLNQINAKDTEPVPENAQKKAAIVATLLRNLHAVFSGGRVLTTANLTFRPIALNEQCNQFLTADRGWFEGGRDLSQLPPGDITLEGVPYLIRDFRTSPLPSCVMLAGPGARGQLPDAVPGLPVTGKADALYFLHTMSRTGEWRAERPEDMPPAVFQYVVHYADGETVTVPVLYGQGVDHWISRQPVGLPNASVAWAAPLAGGDAGDQAVLYQFQWANPRPEVDITGVDMTYGPEGSRYGVPALIAVTAAVQQ